MSLPLSRSVVISKQIPLILCIAGVEQEISVMVRYVNYPEIEVLSVLAPAFNKHIDITDIINEETLTFIRGELA